MQLSISFETFSELWQQIGPKWNAATAALSGFEPGFSLILFAIASFLMIWRLGVLERKGLEGTVLGTVIMPYASGFSNLAFAYVMGRSGGNGTLVLENCLVNNVTNLTLLIGLPALLWPLTLFPDKRKSGFEKIASKSHRLNYLSLLLTLLALLFFTGVLWALARDGRLDFGDGLVLVGVFLFWQIFHVFDVLKHNIYRGQSLKWSIIWVHLSGDHWRVGRLPGHRGVGGMDSPQRKPVCSCSRTWVWLTGLLMVLPNALLALYYARIKRADIVFSSQIGDGHICIPMCIGLFALFAPDYHSKLFSPGRGHHYLSRLDAPDLDCHLGALAQVYRATLRHRLRLFPL